MTDPTIWNQIFIWPILNALMALNKGFTLLGLPGSFGWAIISLTVLVRLLLYPLTAAQLKSAKKMQELQPHLEAIKAKHGHDKQKFAQAQMELYREHGVNPAAGCLPLLISMPIFIALYQVFWNVLGNGDLSSAAEQINKIVYSSFLKIDKLDLHFFGLNLAQKPSDWGAAGWGLLLVPLLTAGLYYLQVKTMPMANPAPKTPPKEKKEGLEAAMLSFNQGPMALLFPVMIGFFSYSFPVGLALYWNTFTLLAIAQQSLMKKPTK